MKWREGAHLEKIWSEWKMHFSPLPALPFRIRIGFQFSLIQYSWIFTTSWTQILLCFVLITLIRFCLAQEITPLEDFCASFIALVTAWCLLVLSWQYSDSFEVKNYVIRCSQVSLSSSFYWLCTKTLHCVCSSYIFFLLAIFGYFSIWNHFHFSTEMTNSLN